MSRISSRFDLLRSQGRKAFVPYITAGWPSPEFTLKLAQMLEQEGADILELGLPHTDPIADGPTNQRAAQEALDSGMTCLLYTSPSPRDATLSRMPSSA